MSKVKLTIDEKELEVEEGISILSAAREAEIYIPTLCSHPDLPPLKEYPLSSGVYHGSSFYENEEGKLEEGCRLCLVELGSGEGGNVNIIRSCIAEVREGMVVKTDTAELQSMRKANLSRILSTHPHACLTCAQKEGCSRTQCSANVPDNEKCCILLGSCELEKVSDYIGISPETPKYVPRELPCVEAEPLFVRDYNLCIGCSRCVRACNDIRGIKALGMVNQSGNAVVGTTAESAKASGCKFCGACVEVCPTGALLDKTSSAPYDRAQGYSPCTSACPVHMDIPRYTRLIAEGKAEEALAVIREKVPFPRVLGRICMHPCESSCRRSELNESISICALKRYASEMDKGLWKKAEDNQIPESTGKKIAVVGSGPAGMTCAFYLAKSGHSVTVFEGAPIPGGMLANTIPLYRLPKDYLDADIQEIMDIGEIELRTGEQLGVTFSFEDIRSAGFDATFLAVGLQAGRKLDIHGIDNAGVLQGLEFLKSVRLGECSELAGKVVVIGGGNVAVDVARTARRLGAAKVTMVALETRDEMPAHDWEISAAEEEDIEVQCSWGPMKIITEEDSVKGLELKQCTSVFDSSGNFCPEYNDSKTTKLEADTVIAAIGQAADLSFIEESSKALLGSNNMLTIDANNLSTGIPGVYAGGDIARMPGTVVDAIQMGRLAAIEINRYLGTDPDISEVLVPFEEPSENIGRDENFYDLQRAAPHTLKLEDRVCSVDEVELTFDEQRAAAESRRCLQCDLRLSFRSVPLPPEPWQDFKAENIQTVPETEGVIQLLDETKQVLLIKGSANMRSELQNQLGSNEKAKFFIFEEDPMYTKRESELLQQHLQQHGSMPSGGDEEMDDLF
jgi:NADPH-dependent glutamate synthase beta subunit-like oxidoreductase